MDLENFKPTVLAVVGSRTFNDIELFNTSMEKVISKFPTINTIVSGGAKGADQMGEKFATDHKFTLRIKFPNWDKYGKKAGYLRNIEIIDTCDICIAFWDGESKGTKHDIDLCIEKNKPYMVVRF